MLVILSAFSASLVLGLASLRFGVDSRECMGFRTRPNH